MVTHDIRPESERCVRLLQIPTLPPLKKLEIYPGSSDVPNAPPIPEYFSYFEVPGVPNEQVAEVLTALIVRRLVERARKAAHPKHTIAHPGASSLIAWALMGGALGASIAILAESLAVATVAPHAIAFQAAGGLGAVLGIMYAWWRRARLVSAYNGLALVVGKPDELLHRNYWLPTALRQLCSPNPTTSLQA